MQHHEFEMNFVFRTEAAHVFLQSRDKYARALSLRGFLHSISGSLTRRSGVNCHCHIFHNPGMEIPSCGTKEDEESGILRHGHPSNLEAIGEIEVLKNLQPEAKTFSADDRPIIEIRIFAGDVVDKLLEMAVATKSGRMPIIWSSIQSFILTEPGLRIIAVEDLIQDKHAIYSVTEAEFKFVDDFANKFYSEEQLIEMDPVYM